MLRRLGLLLTTTVLTAIVTAAPAQARNIGGNGTRGSTCITPGNAQVQNPKSGLPCICVVLPDRSVVRSVGKGPNTTCPPGIVDGH